MNTYHQLRELQLQNQTKREYFADGMSRQLAKETAMLMALRCGFGLIRRTNEIHRIYPNGESRLLCSSESKCDLWHKAHHTMKEQREDQERRKQYRKQVFIELK